MNRVRTWIRQSFTWSIMAILPIAWVVPLRAESRQFTQALPGYTYSFPRDHASHDDYRTEWWYFTGHVKDATNRSFGYELTFFRSGLDRDDDDQSPWNLRNIYLAHFAVTDEIGHKFFYNEKVNRAGLKVADAMQNIPYVFNDLWSMELLGDRFVLRADTPRYSAHLLLTPEKKVAVHGKDGVSQKADCKGCASHYYSITRMKTEGTMFIGSKPLTVDGVSWMDHEFGSNQLTEKQVGWDWYSVQLDNGNELMLYMMRNDDGTIDPNSSGTLVDSHNKVEHILKDQFSITSKSKWKSDRSGATYPMGWHVSVPKFKIELDLDPPMKDQELVTTRSTGVTYWEGACKASGTFDSHPVAGQSYVEMTGYAEKFNKHL